MANSRFPVVLLGLIVWLLAGLADGRAENAAGIRASGLHLVAGNDTDSAAIVVDLGAEVSLRWEALDRPDRLVIDLERVVFVREAARGVDRATGPVGAVRAGLVLSGQSRIVVDLVRPAVIERQDFVRQNGRTRLVLLVRAVPAERFAARAAEDSAARLAARAPSPGWRCPSPSL